MRQLCVCDCLHVVNDDKYDSAFPVGTMLLCYLFVLSISVCFEALRSVQLDGAAADHLNAALFILPTQGPHTAVHLRKVIQ